MQPSNQFAILPRLFSRLKATLTATTAGALAAAAPAPAAPVVGLADQGAAPFQDSRLTALPVRHARIVVPWDAMQSPAAIARIDTWMAATKAAGISPLVTFGPGTQSTGRLPAVAEYTALTRRFRLRFGHVREYSPWNEPNLARKRAGNDPAKVAGYYKALRRGCPSCKVLGADVVDSTSMDDWLKRYLKQFRGPKPKYWGLHNYVDANSPSSWGTRRILRLVPGQIWFTETGGVYRRAKLKIPKGDRRHKMRTGTATATRATRRVFSLAKMSRRISRVYLYHWQADRRAKWDSALIDHDGAPRRSYTVFANAARRGARVPAS